MIILGTRVPWVLYISHEISIIEFIIPRFIMTVYIIFSERIKSFYVGYTSVTLEERLKKHNSNHSGYTGRARDWKVVYTKETLDRKEAILLETRIKNRGARRYLKSIGY